jgi:hypothetical protein
MLRYPMADDAAFSDSPVITNSVDDPKVLEGWSDAWDDILEKSGDEEPSSPPAAPTKEPAKPEAKEAKEEVLPEHKKEPEPESAPEAPIAKPRRRLAETVKNAPSEEEINEAIDGPKAPVAEAEPIDEFEKLEPHPSSSPESKSHFRALKDSARAFKEERDQYKKKLAAYEKLAPAIGVDLEDGDEAKIQQAAERILSLKNGVPNPVVAAKHHFLEQLANETEIKNSFEYVEKVEMPIRNQLHDWLADISQYLTASPEQIQKWQSDVLSFDPHEILKNPNWFSQERDRIAREGRMDQAAYDRLRFKEANLTEIERGGKQYLGHMLTNEQARLALQQRNQEAYAREYRTNIEDEVGIAIRSDMAHLGKYLPKPLDGVTDAAERAEIQERNRYFDQVLEPEFQKVVVDALSGPRAVARRALKYIDMREEIKSLRKVAEEKKTLDSELEAAKKEISRMKDKRGLYGKLRDIPLKPTAGTGSGKIQPRASKLSDSSKIDFTGL